MTQQANNTKANVLLTYNGRTQTMAEWAREAGMDKRALWKRLKRGWSLDRALIPPTGIWEVDYARQ
jgi:transcriptional regulator of acetoin/glycerol metabolism